MEMSVRQDSAVKLVDDLTGENPASAEITHLALL